MKNDLQRKKARGLSASKDHLLGKSEEEEKEKEPGIQEKAVRKRKVQEQGIDGINKRLGKFSKLGQGNLEQNKGSIQIWRKLGGRVKEEPSD